MAVIPESWLAAAKAIASMMKFSFVHLHLFESV
jgi:hypothetical protein